MENNSLLCGENISQKHIKMENKKAVKLTDFKRKVGIKDE